MLKRFVLFILLGLVAVQVYAFEGKEHIYASLLASGNNERIILSAQLLYDDNPANTRLLDAIAEILLQGSQEKVYISSDGLSWLAKTLGQSKLLRYKAILEEADKYMEVRETEYKKTHKTKYIYSDDVEDEQSYAKESEKFQYTRPELKFGSVISHALDIVHYEVNHTKVREYIKKSLAQLGVNNHDKYQAGQFDFVLFQKELEADELRIKANRSLLALKEIKRKQDLDSVLTKLGTADSASVYYLGSSRGFVRRVLSLLQIHYNDKAIIQFTSKNNKWIVHRVLLFEPHGIQGGLQVNEAKTVRDTAQNLYLSYTVDPALLDIAAKRIWENKDTDDAGMADAVAWLCKLIGRSRNIRYKSIIQNVAQSAKNEKVKSNADDQIEFLTYGITEQLSF